MNILKQGNYNLIKYHDEFICLDFINDSVGITLQVFENENEARAIFEKVIELSEGVKEIHLESFIRSIAEFK